MPHFVHFYPFRPDRLQGGTLRLKTALEATRPLGPSTLVWFEATVGEWTTTEPGNGAVHQVDDGGLKRRLFPHTLFESGRHAVAALADSWGRHAGTDVVPILHTSYLAPVLRSVDAPAIVDVYDLVWRGHQIDAQAAGVPLRLLRESYARSVKLREERALRRARGLVVAGWDDHRRLERLGPPSSWCPTGMSAAPLPRRAGDERLRIGFLGNFAHQATVDSALALLAAPAAAAPGIEVVLGGWDSDRHPALQDTPARVLGAVADPSDFWREVDVAVIPVFSGTGIKCKIAEALLADRAVVTTPLGAAGFSPQTRGAMVVVDRLDDLDEAACRDAAATSAGDAQQFSLPEAAASYRAFLDSVL